MVRLVLIALFAACYEPQFADCADTCGTSRICPEGLTCESGFCRAPGATGSCELDPTVDAGIDASTTNPPPDGPPPMACPPTPIMQGCSPVGPMPTMPYCHVTCAAKTGTDALAFTVGSWHAAVIADATELAAAMTSSANQPAWIGLRQPPAQAMPQTAWAWLNGAPLAFSAWAPAQPDDGNGTENDAEQCGLLAEGKWADEACTLSRPFVIEPF